MPLEGLQFGPYKLLHMIRSCGMGEVHHAEDRHPPYFYLA
jgi:hypothetical protein